MKKELHHYFYNYETEKAITRGELEQEYNKALTECPDYLQDNEIADFESFIEFLSAMGGELVAISEDEYRLYKDIELYYNDIQELTAENKKLKAENERLIALLNGVRFYTN